MLHHDCPLDTKAVPTKTCQGKSSSVISETVAEKVKPIYDRLISDVLLARCLSVMTHAKIWARCPKHIFVGRRRVEVETALFVSEFNSGSVGLKVKGFFKY
ncbi:unnamed protein product [Lymnaea stagnalis]|uniref:Uncharacterized protein n=1 Tax=Lymnaea stagnalis TaxID=6523 RepID=A0AAV2H044_LYMST